MEVPRNQYLAVSIFYYNLLQFTTIYTILVSGEGLMLPHDVSGIMDDLVICLEAVGDGRGIVEVPRKQYLAAFIFYDNLLQFTTVYARKCYLTPPKKYVLKKKHQIRVSHREI